MYDNTPNRPRIAQGRIDTDHYELSPSTGWQETYVILHAKLPAVRVEVST